jgi:chromosome segregation protein
LTEQPESAQEILADLSANKSGRASVAALSIGIPDDKQLVFGGELSADENKTAAQNGLKQGQIVRALDVVQTDPSVDKLLRALLGRTFIASDLPTATAQIQNGHAGCDFVTLTGDLLSRHGIYTGGYLNGHGNSKAPGSILGRKNQITELQAELTQIQNRVAEASRKRGALLSEQTELQASLQEAQTELREQEVAIATREGEFNALQNSNRLLHQKIDTVVFEVQSLAAQEQESLQKRNALTAQLDKFETSERGAQEQVAALTADLENLRQQRDVANAALTESKIALASDEQLAASFRQQQQSLAQRIRELTQVIEQRKGECASFISRKEQAETEIQESRGQIEKISHDRRQVNAQAAELLAQKNSQETEITARDESLRSQRSRLTELQNQRGGIEIELAQKNMSFKTCAKKFSRNITSIWTTFAASASRSPTPTKVRRKWKHLRPNKWPRQARRRIGTPVAQQIEALQKRLDEIGPVNLVAIEEYEETEQRHQFLTAQHDDLVHAKIQLLEVINRINTQTRQMFLETFDKIRDNFRAMFVDVFGGGKADLILSDENDVLESGIDIVARPPGKQLQSISLLSGGEQTMVAVSLLFSIYQVKPSPFCVLDELDAPLDESNINRFVRVLQRFLAHSQFIIITHNKRTIGWPTCFTA